MICNLMHADMTLACGFPIRAGLSGFVFERNVKITRDCKGTAADLSRPHRTARQVWQPERRTNSSTCFAGGRRPRPADSTARCISASAHFEPASALVRCINQFTRTIPLHATSRSREREMVNEILTPPSLDRPRVLKDGPDCRSIGSRHTFSGPHPKIEASAAPEAPHDFIR
jgi:hypothetical protein